jgi:hypothetical protein
VDGQPPRDETNTNPTGIASKPPTRNSFRMPATNFDWFPLNLSGTSPGRFGAHANERDDHAKDQHQRVCPHGRMRDFDPLD